MDTGPTALFWLIRSFRQLSNPTREIICFRRLARQASLIHQGPSGALWTSPNWDSLRAPGGCRHHRFVLF